MQSSEACVVRRLHWHLVPWKGRKWRKAQIQNFVIRDMFLTPNVNAYERNILSTPNGNVHKRRVFRRATQYVKVCGYDKEQWASQATTQRWWSVMVPCSDWSTLVPQQSLTSESEEKHHTMPGVSYQEVLFLFAVISHLTWTCELCILRDSTHRASRSPKCIEHSYAYRFPVCVKILAVPSTPSSVTTASSSTLPSSSLVPFRLHFVFTTVTSSGTISTPLHRLSDEVWYHFDFTSSSLPSPILQPVDTIVIKLGTISTSLHLHCRHQFWNHFDFTSSF